MDAHPQHELVPIDAQVAGGDREVGGQQEQARLDRVVEQGEVVLAEHPLREHAREGADLCPQQKAR